MTAPSRPSCATPDLDQQLERVVTTAQAFGLLRVPKEWPRMAQDERNRWAAYESLKLRQRSHEPTVAAMWASAGDTETLHAPTPTTSSKPRFVRTRELTDAALELAAMLPSGLAGIAGIPRSGMLPASQIAMHLHLPLYTLAGGVLYEVGHGYRLRALERRRGPIAVIDDTIHNGGTIADIRAGLERRGKSYVAPTYGPDGERVPILWGVCYAEPRGAHLVDYVARELRTPHLLEWNLFSSPWSQHFATDLDGILCPDFAPEDDDDGPRYRRAIATRRPLHLYRYGQFQAIITARLERYRPQTEAWLRRWRVRPETLVMGPWRTQRERAPHCMGSWKAEQLNRLAAEPRKFPIALFVESCPIQAAIIATRTPISVLCPAAGGIL